MVAVIAVLLLSVTRVAAFTYQDEDLLLVFRKDGYDDIEFNLGNVASILNANNGSGQVITNWDASLVTATYGTNLTDGVKAVLVAATGADSADRRLWVTCGESSASPLDRTPSQWQLLWSKVNAVGDQPQLYTLTSSVPSFVSSPTLIASYSYIASNAGSQSALIPRLGGASAYVVENTIPGDLRLVEVRPSSITPKPAAPVVGTFSLDASGTLRFSVAGTVPLPTSISGIAANGGDVALTFDTIAGVKYRLRYTDQLNASPSAWTVAGDSVIGAGTPATLMDSPNGTARFYVVESF